MINKTKYGGNQYGERQRNTLPVLYLSVWANVRKVEMLTIGIIVRNATSINQEQECDI